MATQVVEMSGDEAALFRSLSRVIQKEVEHERQLVGVGDAGASAGFEIEGALKRIGKANDRELGQLIRTLGKIGPEGRKAASVLESELESAQVEAAGGMEAVLNRIKQLKPEVAESADKIKSELAEAAKSSEMKMKSLIDRLKLMGPTGKQVADQLQADMARAGERSEDSIEEVIAQVRRINPEAGRAADQLHRRINESTKKSEESFRRFGATAKAQLVGIVGGYVSVQGAIRKVIELNRDVIESNREVLRGLEGVRVGDRVLRQVQKDGDFGALRERADELAVNFGIDRLVARNLVFSARSGGFESALEFIASNNETLAAESQGIVAGRVPELFKRTERISPEQAINATLAGSRESVLTFEQLAEALPQAAEGVAPAGATSDETIAAMSVLASRFKTALTLADRLKIFGTRVALDEGLAGSGLIDAVGRLQARSPEQQQEFLGESQELNTIYKFLTEDLSRIVARRTEVREAIESTGTAESPVAKRRADFLKDPNSVALLATLRERNRVAVERERRRGVGEAAKQARLESALATQEIQGISEFRIAAGESAAAGSRAVGLPFDPSVVSDVAARTPLTTDVDASFGATGGFASIILKAIDQAVQSALRTRENDPIVQAQQQLLVESQRANDIAEQQLETAKETALNTSPPNTGAPVPQR